MTSVGPYNESYNMTHMFDIQDIRGHLPLQSICSGTLLSEINKNKNFESFKILIKISKLDFIFNSEQSEYTIFIPSEDKLSKNIKNMIKQIAETDDISLARKIVKGSIIKRQIPKELLYQSNAYYIYTEQQPNRLFITNINGQLFINNNIKIFNDEITTSNGIIHTIDNLINIID